MGFKTKIYLLVVALLVMGYGVFTFFSYRASEEVISKNIQQNLTSIAKNNADYMDILFSEKLKALDAAAKSISISTDSPDALQHNIVSLQKGLNSSAVYIGLENKEIYTSFEWEAPADFDVTSRPWYVAAKNAKTPIVLDPYVDANNDYLSTLASGVYDEDKQFLGILGIDITLDFFSNAQKRLK